MDNNELRHYGILGMKWGVRRTEQQLAKARGRVSELEEKLQRKTGGKSGGKHTSTNSKVPKKNVKDMSDEELRAKINRIQMERQLAELTSGDKKRKTSKGRTFVGEVLEKSGKNIATQAVTYALGRMVNAAFSGKAGEDIVNPKKGQKDK